MRICLRILFIDYSWRDIEVISWEHHCQTNLLHVSIPSFIAWNFPKKRKRKLLFEKKTLSLRKDETWLTSAALHELAFEILKHRNLNWLKEKALLRVRKMRLKKKRYELWTFLVHNLLNAIITNLVGFLCVSYQVHGDIISFFPMFVCILRTFLWRKSSHQLIYLKNPPKHLRNPSCTFTAHRTLT